MQCIIIQAYEEDHHCFNGCTEAFTIAVPGPQPKDKGKKGKTLEELEEEEGGVVKESQVPMAHVKRAQMRKGKTAGGGKVVAMYSERRDLHGTLCGCQRTSLKKPYALHQQ
jgi:hypothetical protein